MDSNENLIERTAPTISAIFCISKAAALTHRNVIMIVANLVSVLVLLFPFMCYGKSPEFSIDDTLSFNRVGQVAASPDHKQVAYVVMSIVTEKDNKKWQTSLYLSDSKSKTEKLITTNNISSPTWSADGKKIYYVASGNQYRSIFSIDLQTRNINKIIEFKSDISAFQWAPNEKDIAFVATDLNSSQDKSYLQSVATHQNARLYFVDTTQKNMNVIALTSSNYSIALTYSDFLLERGFSWSPDSKNIAFVYQAESGAKTSSQSKLAIINLATQHIQFVPYTENQSARQPIYSPNGKWIAFRSSPVDLADLKNNYVLYQQICYTNTETFNTTCLRNTENQDPVIIGWNATSNLIYVFDWYKTSGLQVYGLSLDTQTPVISISNLEGYIDPLSLSLSQDHATLGFRYETPNQGPQAYISDLNHFKLKQISQLSFTKKNLGNVKVIHWKSTDGTPIEGLLITPPDYQSAHAYPLLVDIHGGPTGAWSSRYLGGCEEYSEAFVPGCDANILSQGFIIFKANYRGSSGYGLQFTMSNYRDFGGGDYQDIMSGVNDLINHGIADPKHMAVIGWSYGGYMTAWVISQTQQFKAAIDGDGFTDLISMTNTTDVPWYLVQYLGNTYLNNSTLYLERAPIMKVKNITTPLLLLHGGKDIRVPVTQSQELYNALTAQHKTATMLLAPAEEHVPDDPNVIAGDIEAINEWLKQAL